MRNRFISFTAVLLVLCFVAAVPAMAQRVVINADRRQAARLHQAQAV